MLFAVVDGTPHPLSIVLLHDGAHGADQRALAAQDAVGVEHGQVKGGGDLVPRAAVGGGQAVQTLQLLTGLDAAAALDALGRVFHNGGVIHTDGLVAGNVGKLGAQQVEAAAECLQLAVAVSGTGQAVLLVVGQHQLQHAHLCVVHLLGVGEHLHALTHRGGAGGLQVAAALDLHHAHAAVGLGGLIGVVAHVGNVDIQHAGGVDDQSALLHFQREIVDLDMYLAHRMATSSWISNTSGKCSLADKRADWEA